ncbi:putative RING-type E3 ubiquitin transferase C3H69 isoform X1 [Camellia sinensis]|uniref:putative RING-type E3 ubiquitin transferase C3H69 isoform X1 n=1 Tax=Camellia sinensis TaxID=4442 RepID=UPI001035B5B3|nr:putative RING-type E3 ubiquitin transferase C3H69 isoform X1 [Camellia sinensis]XP_028113974.1 putative RING-type E3 ubiquitin transferase C3H69 isoform X1 [Camellia sinensis]XP_028113975.1 putative RING-type E3 ubiquitin transferase C3H69 isoform X1 [Camellia sinensis]XP_028113976.1 putative RING-type E3 ubiquitin transferase C3H69 isoform X1 [Camellia sinensis]XP_028113977.1 putative RING-type E3 ubiquitin transferase C3H69 isoform X1 [Camellia sinensis]XP_028113978.1 putative RING-type E
MSKRVLCKFFAHGACLKGEHCEFSHDWKDPSNNVCTFYQKGVCSYGSRCRYEHVKVSRSQSSTASSSTISHQFLVSDSTAVTCSSRTASGGLTTVPGLTSELSASSRPFFPPAKVSWNQTSGHRSLLDIDDVDDSKSLDPADLSICSFAAAGCCPRGDKCPHIHGHLCPSCGKHCLHPFRPQEREEHIKTCEKKQNHLEALKHSQDIECSVCLERVLSKPTAAERKFGVLSECDHPFCISCIRNWRSSSPTSGMDVNSTLRACPICRKVSYFVIPSVIWYSTKEEKQEIVDSYKAKLRSIDCKHFDFGNGTCPFGTSCFYKHTVKPGSYLWNSTLMTDVYSSSFPDMDAIEFSSHSFDNHAYRDGRLEEVVLRHLGAEDGHTVIAKNIRLSDFLRSLHIR